MADLPADRVTAERPFLHCGVDYAGPFSLKTMAKRSTKKFKGYIAIFVCFATKAVHIETVSGLSTEVFIAALRRFIARRGKPSVMHSDCGTNFVGANRELQQLLKQFRDSKHDEIISDILSAQDIQWKFNPASAPHFGGLWEAAVKSMKHHLLRVMKDICFTFEEMATLTSQIEAVLNSRPICPLSSDPNDLSCLTPGHFLIGAPLTAPPEPDLQQIQTSRLSRWQQIQVVQQHFWKRWHQEYLHNLQKRPKWNFVASNIKEGDLVLIKEDNLPPLQWKLGRITETYPGTDNLVRSVKVRTATGDLKRPIAKLVLLPVENPTDFQGGRNVQSDTAK